MNRVLITGGNGFIGRHTTRNLLDQGFEVIVAGRAGGHKTDLLEPGAPQRLIAQTRPDVLIHLAWETSHGKFWHAETNSPWLKASIQLLDSFLEHGGKRAVFAGSCAEYDWTTLDHTGRASETDTPLHPATPYGQAKHAMFSEITRAMANGASIAWGRLFLLYGEHEHRDRFIPSIICNLLAGNETPMSSGNQVRDLMHSRDAGRAFAALATSDLCGAINIATGKGKTLKSIARNIAKVLGREELLKIHAMADRPDDPPALVADVDRLTDELNFSPALSLQNGLKQTIEYWRHEQNK